VKEYNQTKNNLDKNQHYRGCNIAVRVGLALGSDPAEFIRAQEAAFGISFYDEPVIREKTSNFSYEPASRETKSVV
jgi:hypothetical protein